MILSKSCCCSFHESELQLQTSPPSPFPLLWHQVNAVSHSSNNQHLSMLYNGAQQICAFCRLDYCNSLLYGIADSQLRRLQSVQNAAARLITGTRRTEHITPVLQSLHWLPVRQRIMFKLAVLVHKCLNGCAPAYLIHDCRLIRPCRSGLRSSSSMIKLEVPPTRTTIGDRSFAVDGPRVWNSLPASIRDPSLSLTVFTNRLKTYLFRQ